MKLKHIWLCVFPLLFLPNLGFGTATANGSLQLSDFLIWPYLVLLLFALSYKEKLNVGRLTPWLIAFVAWAFVSTITIPFRFDYAADPSASFGPLNVGDGPVTFGLLKLAKLCLYGLAGVWTARALADEHARDVFDWSLLAAGVIAGISLVWLGSGQYASVTNAENTYSASNGISVMLAILLCYLSGHYLTGQGSPRWRRVARIGFVVMASGFVLSDGRGGWLAALAGIAYLCLRLGLRRQLLTYGGAALVVIAALYLTQSDFKQQVDMTLFPPSSLSGYQGTRTIGTLDDGARFQTWAHEAPKLVNAPVLGTGFYHRGGLSGLWPTGSHNFFIQMLLETGLVGGTLVVCIAASMWRQGSALVSAGLASDVSLKAALVSAVAGGMGGEYFYGGIILFALFAVYAPFGGRDAMSLGNRARRSRAAYRPEIGTTVAR